MHSIYQGASLVFSVLMVMFAIRESVHHWRSVIRALKEELGVGHRDRYQLIEIVFVLLASGLIASGPGGYYTLNLFHHFA
jgi:hypothetical protein